VRRAAKAKPVTDRSISRSGALDRGLVTLALAACLALAMCGPARAVILPAVTIDGPSEEIVGFGGIAMAEDGSGGMVYLKRVQGVAHVFVARYLNGHWQAPIRVDTEQPFAASWPRIGAGAGGQLVVVWATPFATEHELPVDELLGATLGPGSASFGPAILIDPDIRDGTGTSPDLAMSSTGQAVVVYRVVRSAQTHGAIPLLRPGDVVEDVRMARFTGERWSRIGIVNRNTGVSMRPPTPSNAPRIAIGPGGNGVVVWQEPDIDGVARIWARRFFASSLDYVLPVSAASYLGAPLGTDADAPSVAMSRFGQADVAYRQGAGAGSSLPGARIFLNILPDGESADGSQFSGASIVDTGVSGGAAASVGPPSVDIDDKQQMRLLYDANGEPRVVTGNEAGLSGVLSLGPSFVGAEPYSASVMNPAGGGVSAWPSADRRGRPAVAVREDFPSAAVQTALVAGGAGGEIGELAVARSGLGDGLVGFRQGPLGAAAIVAAQATAPPAPVVMSLPKSWVRPSGAFVSWEAASSVNLPIGYRVVLDGRPLQTHAGSLSLHLDTRGLGEGVHRVQVLATDSDGQATLSAPSPLRLDGQPPSVRFTLTRGGRAVIVRVSDHGSGLDTHAVSVSFGDGGHAAHRARMQHAYSRGGLYTIVVHVRDRLGNQAVVRRLVSVR
jgi:hypothetical protein